jgi:hypothetical protein
LNSIHRAEAAAGSGRSEHRNVDILIPVARQRESLAGPNVPCERRTDPAEPPPPTSPQRQPQHSATATQVWPPRVYAAFLQNAPVVRHTRGFTPGWYPVPRWGTPNASPSPEPPPPPRPYLPHRPHAITTTHRVNDDCFSSTATIKPSHTGTYPQSTKRQRDRAGASIGTSTSLSPSRDSAKAQPAPTFPASAGPIPRSPQPSPTQQRDRAGASIGTSTS